LNKNNPPAIRQESGGGKVDLPSSVTDRVIVMSNGLSSRNKYQELRIYSTNYTDFLKMRGADGKYIQKNKNWSGMP
jgi:hypothetical protein